MCFIHGFVSRDTRRCILHVDDLFAEHEHHVFRAREHLIRSHMEKYMVIRKDVRPVLVLPNL